MLALIAVLICAGILKAVLAKVTINQLKPGCELAQLYYQVLHESYLHGSILQMN